MPCPFWKPFLWDSLVKLDTFLFELFKPYSPRSITIMNGVRCFAEQVYFVQQQTSCERGLTTSTRSGN